MDAVKLVERSYVWKVDSGRVSVKCTFNVDIIWYLLYLHEIYSNRVKSLN